MVNGVNFTWFLPYTHAKEICERIFLFSKSSSLPYPTFYPENKYWVWYSGTLILHSLLTWSRTDMKIITHVFWCENNSWNQGLLDSVIDIHEVEWKIRCKKTQLKATTKKANLNVKSQANWRQDCDYVSGFKASQTLTCANISFPLAHILEREMLAPAERAWGVGGEWTSIGGSCRKRRKSWKVDSWPPPLP